MVVLILWHGLTVEPSWPQPSTPLKDTEHLTFPFSFWNKYFTFVAGLLCLVGVFLLWCLILSLLPFYLAIQFCLAYFNFVLAAISLFGGAEMFYMK